MGVKPSDKKSSFLIAYLNPRKSGKTITSTYSGYFLGVFIFLAGAFNFSQLSIDNLASSLTARVVVFITLGLGLLITTPFKASTIFQPIALFICGGLMYLFDQPSPNQFAIMAMSRFMFFFFGYFEDVKTPLFKVINGNAKEWLFDLSWVAMTIVGTLFNASKDYPTLDMIPPILCILFLFRLLPFIHRVDLFNKIQAAEKILNGAKTDLELDLDDDHWKMLQLAITKNYKNEDCAAEVFGNGNSTNSSRRWGKVYEAFKKKGLPIESRENVNFISSQRRIFRVLPNGALEFLELVDSDQGEL